MTQIYVLKCDNNKYYVGKTNKSVEERFKEHIKNPCVWTRKYKPIQILESFELKSKFDEDTTTLEYMEKYGIENVRGGTYTQLFLPKHQYVTLKQQLIHVDDKCFKCQKYGHFSKDCLTQDIEYIETQDIQEIQETESENNVLKCITSCLKHMLNNWKQRNISNDYYELDHL